MLIESKKDTKANKDLGRDLVQITQQLEKLKKRKFNPQRQALIERLEARQINLINLNNIPEGYVTNIGKTASNSEFDFLASMNTEGWSSAKKGWPDFLCWRGEELICVEVKRNKNDELKEHQKLVNSKLAAVGIKCYSWNPDEGLKLLT